MIALWKYDEKLTPSFFNAFDFYIKRQSMSSIICGGDYERVFSIDNLIKFISPFPKDFSIFIVLVFEIRAKDLI